ncbi:phenylacetaldoxime dehydratase family [Fusarium mundagurra]|uniref:Phenylacetaldoxime dehydratase family n=1 Tax=Fusarium mundagurra TaxID=1567541 RepID=A0A8H5YJ22_9HYPO|nr:phenylacetaldoxime dehydratase family [Fusarium mundagurra]
MSCPARKYALRKPQGHKLPIPRWHLALPDGVTHVCTAYIGVQKHSDAQDADIARSKSTEIIQGWLNSDIGPETYETFAVIDGCDVQESTLWVCYWSDKTKYEKGLNDLSLNSIYAQLPESGRASVGIWREAFITEFSRLETNYSGLDYLPGLAKLPGASFPEHELSAYWGAARDRIPSSAFDLFPPSKHNLPVTIPPGVGQYLIGTNDENVAHIRSGQFWENCGQQEADSYNKRLEPTLHSGLQYLWDNSPETGALGLRYLRNQDSSLEEPRPRKESCGAGFFTNLEALEVWAKSHRSHLAIYRGALTHYRTFGDARKFRTWHEVSILRAGDARFEYLNCVPKTGVIQGVTLKAESIE